MNISVRYNENIRFKIVVMSERRNYCACDDDFIFCDILSNKTYSDL